MSDEPLGPGVVVGRLLVTWAVVDPWLMGYIPLSQMADGRMGVCGWLVHRGRSPGDIQTC